MNKPRNWHALNAIQRKAGPMKNDKREQQKEAKLFNEALRDGLLELKERQREKND